jgi:hypothetical protein
MSAHNDDPGFVNLRVGATVTVEGVKQDQCFTADEERGEAHCYTVPLELVGDEIKSEIKRGKVVIHLPVDNRE